MKLREAKRPANPRLNDFLCFAIYSANLAFGRAYKPILEQLASVYSGKMRVAKVDVDQNQKTTMRFNVRSIPTLLFFKNGKHVDTVVGLSSKQALEAKIQQHI